MPYSETVNRPVFGSKLLPNEKRPGAKEPSVVQPGSPPSQAPSSTQPTCRTFLVFPPPLQITAAETP